MHIGTNALVTDLTDLSKQSPLQGLFLSTSTPAKEKSKEDGSHSSSLVESTERSSNDSASTATSPRSSGKSARPRSAIHGATSSGDPGFIVIETSRHMRKGSSGNATPRSLPTTSTRTSPTTGLCTTTTTTTTLASLIPTTIHPDVGNDADSGSEVEVPSHPFLSVGMLGHALRRSSSRKSTGSSSVIVSPRRTPSNSVSGTPELGRKKPAPAARLEVKVRKGHEDFDKLRYAAQNRDDLIAAIWENDLVAISAAREKFPLTKVWTTDELPMVDPATLNGNMVKVVAAYEEAYGKDEDLMAYAQWCDELYRRTATVQAATALSSCVPIEVRNLCLWFRGLNEVADEESLSASVKKMTKTLALKDLAEEQSPTLTSRKMANKPVPDGEGITALALAQQPFASTQMMLQKMPLLAEYRAAKHLDPLHAKLLAAHRMRKESLVTLQETVDRTRPLWSRPIPVEGEVLVKHCVNVYAHCMTNPIVNLVADTSDKDRLLTMRKALDELIELDHAKCSALEMAALRFVRDGFNALLLTKREGPGKKPREEVIDPAVFELCQTLDELDTAASPDSLKERASATTKLLTANPHINAHELARQPFTNTSVLLDKFILLKPYMDARTFSHGKTQVRKANALREGAAAALQNELIKKPLEEATLVATSSYLNAWFRTRPRPDEAFALEPVTPKNARALETWMVGATERTDNPLNIIDVTSLGTALRLVNEAVLTREQVALFKKPFDETKVMTLATDAYERFNASPRKAFVIPSTLPDSLAALVSWIDGALQHADRFFNANEMAALTHLRGLVKDKLARPHPQKN